MKKLFLSPLILLLIKCSLNTPKETIQLKIEEANLETNILKVQFINNSSNDYFITLDSSRVNDYLSTNKEINQSIHININIWENSKLITPKYEILMIKPIGPTLNSKNCFDIDRKKKNKYLYNINENVIKLKSKSKTKASIPFYLYYDICNGNYSYEIKKDKKYYIQINYKMSKQINDRLGVKNKSFIPYYKKITSNKVPIKIIE